MARVIYEFVSTGYGAVRDEFVSIGAAATASGAVVERASKKQADVRTMTAKQATAELEKLHRKENDDLLKQLNSEVAAYDKAAAKKIAAEEKVSKAREKEAKKSGDTIVRLAKDAGMRAWTSIASGATSIIGSAVRESFEVADISRRISINARKSGGAFKDPDALRKQFEQTAIETPGVKSQDIATAAEKYIALTGDVDTALNNMKTFATVASATGASVGDVAEAAASLGEKFDVKSIADMQKTMALLTFQGKEGAFELKDMAKQFQRLAAAAQAYGLGKGTEGVQKLGGFLQIARTGTGSGAAAATAAERVFSNLDAKRGAKLESQYGIDIYKDRKLGIKKDFNEVLGDVIAKGGGMNVAAKTTFIDSMFGSYGKRATAPLFDTYKRANEAAGGGKSGEEAGRLAVIKQLEDAGASAAQFSEIQKDASFAQQSASARLTAAWEELKANVGAELVPALANLAPRIADLVPLMGPVITTFVALAEAGKLLLDALYAMHIIDRPVATPLEKRDKAKKALEAFDNAEPDKLWLNDEQMRKRKQLEKDLGDADEAFAPSAPPGAKSNLGKIGRGNETPEAWAKKFADAGSFAPNSPEYEAQLQGARRLATKIDEDPNSFRRGSVGDTEGQKKLVADRQEETVRANAAAQVEMGNLTRKVAMLTGTMANLDAALKKLRPSGGTIVP